MWWNGLCFLHPDWRRIHWRKPPESTPTSCTRTKQDVSALVVQKGLLTRCCTPPHMHTWASRSSTTNEQQENQCWHHGHQEKLVFERVVWFQTCVCACTCSLWYAGVSGCIHTIWAKRKRAKPDLALMMWWQRLLSNPPSIMAFRVARRLKIWKPRRCEMCVCVCLWACECVCVWDREQQQQPSVLGERGVCVCTCHWEAVVAYLGGSCVMRSLLSAWAGTLHCGGT